MKTIDDNYGPNEYTELDPIDLAYEGLTEETFYDLSPAQKLEVLVEMGYPQDTAY
jgi:hypothetical protein